MISLTSICQCHQVKHVTALSKLATLNLEIKQILFFCRRHPSFNVEASLGKEIATTANRGFDDVELKVEPPSQLQPGDLSDQKIVTTDLPLDTSSIKEGKPNS